MRIVVEKLSPQQVTDMFLEFEKRDAARLIASQQLVNDLRGAAASSDPAKAADRAIAAHVALQDKISAASDGEIERIVAGRPMVPQTENLREEVRSIDQLRQSGIVPDSAEAVARWIDAATAKKGDDTIN